MSIRQTSIDCYNQIKESGLLSSRKMEVYEILFRHGPMTANEIVRKAKVSYPNTNPSSFHARLSELKKCNAIIEVGEKRDVFSGKSCYVWDLTDRIPVKESRKTKTKKDRVDDVLNALRSLYVNKCDSTDAEWKAVADLIKTL